MTSRWTFERAYGRLLHLLTAGRGVAWHVGDGTTFRIDPRCRWIRNPSYEKSVVDYLRGRVRPGDCCVDVGAHVGYYALQMAHWTAPNGQVIAFEPNPTAREVLTANVALNHLAKRITVEPLAVSDAPGTAKLFHGGETSGLSRIGAPNPESGDGPSVDVPVVTLDAYCTQHGVIPQWVLIDAEGLEMEVLAGAGGLLVNRRCSFVIEMHPDLWASGRQATAVRLEALLRTCGRSAVALTGQKSVLDDYGTIAIP
jgi:FkbM family methyltransferase